MMFGSSRCRIMSQIKLFTYKVHSIRYFFVAMQKSNEMYPIVTGLVSAAGIKVNENHNGFKHSCSKPQGEKSKSSLGAYISETLFEARVGKPQRRKPSAFRWKEEERKLFKDMAGYCYMDL